MSGLGLVSGLGLGSRLVSVSVRFLFLFLDYHLFARFYQVMLFICLSWIAWYSASNDVWEATCKGM